MNIVVLALCLRDMSTEVEVKQLKQQIQALEAQVKVKDLHIGKLSEQLRDVKRVPVPVTRQPSMPRERPAKKSPCDGEKEKLVSLVKKLFSLLEESERLRLTSLKLKQIDLLEADLDNVLLHNA